MERGRGDVDATRRPDLLGEERRGGRGERGRGGIVGRRGGRGGGRGGGIECMRSIVGSEDGS